MSSVQFFGFQEVLQIMNVGPFLETNSYLIFLTLSWNTLDKFRASIMTFAKSLEQSVRNRLNEMKPRKISRFFAVFESSIESKKLIPLTFDGNK